MLSNLSNTNLFETANFAGSRSRYSNTIGSWFKDKVVENPFINGAYGANPKNIISFVKPAVDKLTGSDKEKALVLEKANLMAEQAYTQGAADAINNMAATAASTTVPDATATDGTIKLNNNTIMGMPSKAVYIGGSIVLAVAVFALIKVYTKH